VVFEDEVDYEWLMSMLRCCFGFGVKLWMVLVRLLILLSILIMIFLMCRLCFYIFLMSLVL